MSAERSSRTLVLGLESAELGLIERWMNEGSLPFLASLFRACPLVKLHTPIHALQIAVWPSLLTGTSPGRHARYVLWSQLRTGTYQMTGRPRTRIPLRRYDEFLADRGVNAVLADIPADVPIPDYRGMHIVDWGTEFRFGSFTTEPHELAARIAREVGPYPIPAFHQTGDSQDAHRELARMLDEGVRIRGALTRWLLRQRNHEHVVSVFSEMHKGAHWLWKYMDPSHIDYEESSLDLRDSVRHIYESVDRELAAIAAELEPQDNLVVFSEQGMQANYRGDHLVEAFLQALGLLVRHRPAAPNAAVIPRHAGTHRRRLDTHSAVARALEAVRARLPEGVKATLRALRGRKDIDWRRTRVFQLPTDRNTYLRVNLHGREPQGCVEPGAEYAALLDRLESEFRALRNAANGQPVVAEVFRMREMFPGDHAEDLPDLAVEWAADIPIDCLQSPSVGTLSRPVRELRSGNHRAEGFLLATGPAFVTGPGRLEGDVLQIPATLLHAHGVPPPAQFERGPLPIVAYGDRE